MASRVACHISAMVLHEFRQFPHKDPSGCRGAEVVNRRASRISIAEDTAPLRLVRYTGICIASAWWCHQMETFSAVLALCARNSPFVCEFRSQRPVTRSFDVFIDIRLNKRLGKQSRRRWLETPSHSLWRHCIGNIDRVIVKIGVMSTFCVSTAIIHTVTNDFYQCLTGRHCLGYIGSIDLSLLQGIHNQHSLLSQPGYRSMAQWKNALTIESL